MNKIIINTFLAICISILLLIISVQFFSFNTSYLYNHINKDVSVNNEDLYTSVSKISDYLQNEIDNISFQITYKDKNVFAFNKKEIKHMEDVKKIYLLMNKFKYFLVTMIFLIVVIIRKKYLINSVYYSIFISFFTLIILFINILKGNFNNIFLKFHELAFNNDLWILNPKTDLLINLVPLDFFIKITFHIAIFFIFLEITIIVVSFFLIKPLIKNFN